MNRYLLLSVLGLAAAGCILYFLFPNEEKKIEKQLHKLSSYVSKKGEEKPLQALSTAANIGSGFANPCRIAVASHSGGGMRTLSRKEITDRILMFRKGYSWLTIKLFDLAVSVDQNQTAEVTATLRIDGSGNGIDLTDLQEMKASMAKLEGKWYLTQLSLSEDFKR